MPLGSSQNFLEEAYDSLGYRNGVLLDAVRLPLPDSDEAKHWIDKGEWLATAEKIKADKVFFVNNDPVIIFSEFEQNPTDENEIINIVRRTWCMARPQRLFLSLPGELRVYNLNESPIKKDNNKIEPLITVKHISDVLEKLKDYRREQLESGYIPEDDRFGKLDERADRQLIQDLKYVRKYLENKGLIRKYAHALIGRSIFIRYLEDRCVLTSEYFKKVVGTDRRWKKLLEKPLEKPAAIQDSEWEKRRYYNVLCDKKFTYALFEQLAEDFNGDLFPKNDDEKDAVTQDHLDILRRFLLGDTEHGQQQHLFFWAYDFEIIPIELISSIYEEFYHNEQGDDDKGTHYTPSMLVEFVLSNVLTEERLAASPKVLDPACGSGIFLVESFRRIVRYKVLKNKQLPCASELRQILRDNITGIEIDESAAYITAFSLYLALLNYQKPPDILAQIEMLNSDVRPLPHLIFNEKYPQDANHYQVIFNKNAFSLMNSERNQIKEKSEQKRRFEGRSEILKLCESPDTLPIEPASFDVVVGNPPWGFVKKKEVDLKIFEAQKHVIRWCDVFGWSVGDNELSQVFIARTFSFLKPGGQCGFLISTGVFFKHHPNSQKFRQRWLEKSTIETVVNFAHVREFYFNKAISPFAFVHYKNSSPDMLHRIRYWSAKKTGSVDKTQAVILSYADLRQVLQNDLKYKDILWKTYWWGNHRDAALVNVIKINQSLDDLTKQRDWFRGTGFKGEVANDSNKASDLLKDYLELPVKYFRRYGSIDKSKLKPVTEIVNRDRDRRLYEGWRLLIKQGITQANSTDGQIVARIESEPYCFRESLYSINMDDAENWERKILIGIVWSSLTRYYLFMTSGSWITWHIKNDLSEVLSLPIRFPSNMQLRRRIEKIVDQLLSWNTENTLFSSEESNQSTLISLEKELDEAIFDLYELSGSERDLITDMCEVGLEFFYRHYAAPKVEKFPVKCQGTIADLPKDRKKERGMEGYLYAFLQMWNEELEPEGEFCWRVVHPDDVPMIAVIFTTQWKNYSVYQDDMEWSDVLARCEKALLMPVSRSIYIDGMLRSVSDTEIIIIKRNERRMWTRSMAREDAEATLLQAMYIQEAGQDM